MSSGGGGGNSGTQTVQQVQKADPWVGQQGHLSYIYQLGQDAMARTPSQAYGGQMTARPNSIQLAANQQMQNTGANMQGFGRGLRSYGDNLLADAVEQPYLATGQEGANPNMLSSIGGNRLDVRNNPHLMPALMGNIEHGASKIRDIALPQLSSQAGAQGGPSAYGGTRHDFLKSQIVGDFERNASDAIANATLGAYNTERGIEAAQEGQRFGAAAGRNLQADQLNMSRSNFLAQLAPQIMQQGVGAESQGLAMLEGAGAQGQGWTQDQLNEMYQKHLQSIDAPWAGVRNYAALVGGAIPGNVASSNTTQLPRPSAMSSAIGGGLGGAALGAGLGSIIPGLGTGLGAGLGAIMGGLGGYF